MTLFACLFLILSLLLVPGAASQALNDGEFAYVAYDSAMYDQVYNFDLATRKMRQLSTWELGSWSPAWSPDGKQIAYVAENGTSTSLFLYNVDMDESGWSLQFTEPRLTDPIWTNDGKWIVAGLEDYPRPVGILVIRSDASDSHTLEMENTRLGSPSPSPDSKQIAFLTNDYDAQSWTLWVVGINDTISKARILIRGVDEKTPAWSPDGRWLVYSSWHPWYEQRASLYALEVATGRKVPLASEMNGVWTPQWSPNGHYLALGYEGGPQILETGLGGVQTLFYPETSLYWLDVTCLQLAQPCSGQVYFLDWDVFTEDSLSWLPRRSWLSYHLSNFRGNSGLQLVDIDCVAVSSGKCKQVLPLPEGSSDIVWRPN